MYSQRFLGRPVLLSQSTNSLRRAVPTVAQGSTAMVLFPSAQLEAQRETRRIPIMQKWKAGAPKTRDQIHKKLERTQRNQQRAEYQRCRLHIKQGTLYEYIEGKTADDETKRKWFAQHFGAVEMKKRTTTEGEAKDTERQQQDDSALEADVVRVSQ